MRNRNNDIKDELRELGASHLAEWQGKTEESAPSATFFSNLTEQVLKEVNNQSTNTPLRVVSRRNTYSRWRIAIAAVVILAVGSWWISNSVAWPGQNKVAELNWQHVADDALQDYVWTNIDDFDLELLEQIAEPATAQQLLENEFDISTETLEDFIQSEEEWLESDEQDLF